MSQLFPISKFHLVYTLHTPSLLSWSRFHFIVASVAFWGNARPPASVCFIGKMKGADATAARFIMGNHRKSRSTNRWWNFIWHGCSCGLLGRYLILIKRDSCSQKWTHQFVTFYYGYFIGFIAILLPITQNILSHCVLEEHGIEGMYFQSNTILKPSSISIL